MKKFTLALLVLVAIVGFMGCTSPTSATVDNSTWFIKGGFDNWAGASSDTGRHYFQIDAANPNTVTVTISEDATNYPQYTNVPFEFVVANTAVLNSSNAPQEYWLSSAATAAPYVFNSTTDNGLGNNINGSFQPTKSTWTFTLDISNASSPTITSITESGTALSAKVYTPWTDVWANGADGIFQTTNAWDTFKEFTETATGSNIWTLNISTATTTDEQFKLAPTNAWGSDIGYSGIIVGTTGNVAITAPSGGNIGFAATVGTSYTITVDFTNYSSTAKPVVDISTP